MRPPADIDVALSRYRLSELVYGDSLAEDDPAETYHEASKLTPAFAGRTPPGAALLETSQDMRELALRAAKRHRHLPARSLPAPRRLDRPLGALLDSRRSDAGRDARPIAASMLATLLHAACGVTRTGAVPRRAAPSGGALYPLELYAFVNAVDGLAPGLYHYEPLLGALEELRPGRTEALGDAFPDPAHATAATVLAVTAMFWRSRFKYGLRAYRFSLLEAGHLMQNVLLASACLGLAALPIGGFYDRRLERLLQIDGVNEGALYCAAVGNRDAPEPEP